MRIGQDRIAVDAFLAPRLAHELVQLARRQLLAPATELVYILTPFTRRRSPGRPRRSWVLVLGRPPLLVFRGIAVSGRRGLSTPHPCVRHDSAQ